MELTVTRAIQLVPHALLIVQHVVTTQLLQRLSAAPAILAILWIRRPAELLARLDTIMIGIHYSARPVEVDISSMKRLVLVNNVQPDVELVLTIQAHRVLTALAAVQLATHMIRL